MIPFFQKAGLPTLPKQNMAEAVEKLLAEFENLLNIKNCAKNLEKPKERIDEFKQRIKEKSKSQKVQKFKFFKDSESIFLL